MFTFIPSREPDEVYAAIRNGRHAHLIDVRSRSDYAVGHPGGAVSIPSEELDATVIRSTLGPLAGMQETLFLLCDTGTHAEHAARRLENLGMRKLALVEGGMQTWRAAGLPIVHGLRKPSFEGQAQILVGLLLLVILAKAMLLHPVFYLMVGILGIGLIAVGLSPHASVGAVLARMPWNRVSARRAEPSV
jgi:rhodanese-related sulfurtransferase